jgi:hypothetical protein
MTKEEVMKEFARLLVPHLRKRLEQQELEKNKSKSKKKKENISSDGKSEN